MEKRQIDLVARVGIRSGCRGLIERGYPRRQLNFSHLWDVSIDHCRFNTECPGVKGFAEKDEVIIMESTQAAKDWSPTGGGWNRRHAAGNSPNFYRLSWPEKVVWQGFPGLGDLPGAT